MGVGFCGRGRFLCRRYLLFLLGCVYGSRGRLWRCVSWEGVYRVLKFWGCFSGFRNVFCIVFGD